MVIVACRQDLANRLLPRVAISYDNAKYKPELSELLFEHTKALCIVSVEDCGHAGVKTYQS